ncbi:MAG: hypothetical protein DI533_10300 [Cereibacter sphaeroides]|uniref:Uncharacterized protein n=1 Tax=Cereibacter sphaeroides TaxID=1063 RepID=A0A2W5S6Y5_CERSP|nr:MAG: hypothetical protein DI533_10300 [Cereibacter sphaeroides]
MTTWTEQAQRAGRTAADAIWHAGDRLSLITKAERVTALAATMATAMKQAGCPEAQIEEAHETLKAAFADRLHDLSLEGEQ